jgi:hypothetical protein
MEFQIWDNLIDDRFLLDLDEESNLYNWRLDNIANRYSFPYKSKGSHLLWGVNFSIDNVPKKIENLYNFLINDVIKQQYKLEAIQINGQSVSQNGTIHVDPGDKTLMVFFNYKWDKEWGGEFQLLEKSNKDYKIVKNIEYVPGRVILFDGNIPHRGLAPTEPYVIRKSLVYRLKQVI